MPATRRPPLALGAREWLRRVGVAEEGFPFREIVQVVGQRIGVSVVSKPLEAAPKLLSFLASFVSADNPSSSMHTEKRPGWKSIEMGLMEELNGDDYFKP